ncbi:38.7 kDa protein [Maruca vitrata nucleopolyhedrovirus]|uniref:38.7 kDa protein n=1 Tax=Maruca vitrata nucleopolyhedrovirus TaxID=1307954 RepID=A1YR67_9ABAC|nr:38.7 kDa protein [Maruca vitrata nucleopolyhedrovirus]ABL75957.1 38.7 kDa protein [Maruca vitrata nucleopolyhedrovirus]
MLSWLWNWWMRSGDSYDSIVDSRFNSDDYKKYHVNAHQWSHIVKWDSFKCNTHSFKYKYVHSDSNTKHYNVIDFCKGLEIAHDDILDCNWDDDQVHHLNEIVLHVPKSKRDISSLGALFATKQGLLEILMRLNFANKSAALLHIQTEGERDDLRDKIESVLKHVKKLNTNSENFMVTHETFKNEVGNRFEQFESRLHELDAKLNTLQSVETAVVASENNYGRVTFPRDITKHQHLAVFSERINDHIKLAFVLGQERHFRKRKMRFEDDMEVLYDGVHPNPLMAIQCINEKLYDKNYKIRKIAKRVIDVDCTPNVVREVIQEVL